MHLAVGPALGGALGDPLRPTAAQGRFIVERWGRHEAPMGPQGLQGRVTTPPLVPHKKIMCWFRVRGSAILLEVAEIENFG